MNDNITEINKDILLRKSIQSAKETCGQDMDAMTGLPESTGRYPWDRSRLRHFSFLRHPPRL